MTRSKGKLTPKLRKRPAKSSQVKTARNVVSKKEFVDLLELEKIDEYGRKKHRKHQLNVRVKKDPVAAVKPEEIDIEALLEAERDRARSEAKPAIADLVRAKTENDKKMIMWGGVTFFMILISVIWIYNLNTVFKKTAAQAGSSPTSDWKKATEDISKQMEEMQADLENIQEFTETATSAPAAIIPAGEARAIVPASSSPVDAENIELLKEKIEGAAETNKIN